MAEPSAIRDTEIQDADSPASALALLLTPQAGYPGLLYLVKRSPGERRRYLTDPSRLHRLVRLGNVSSGLYYNEARENTEVDRMPSDVSWGIGRDICPSMRPINLIS